MSNLQNAEKISITLPPDMLISIKNKVQSGSYGSTSEVIREAIRLWQKQEEAHQERLLSIRNRLEHSENSGAPVPIDEVFQQLENKHRKIIDISSHEDL